MRQHLGEQQNEHVHAPSALPSYKYHPLFLYTELRKLILVENTYAHLTKKKKTQTDARKIHLIQDKELNSALTVKKHQ